MKLCKIMLFLLTVILFASAPVINLWAVEQNRIDTILEGVPTEEADLDIDYRVRVGVSPFADNRNYAVAPFSGFAVSEDGTSVILTFSSDSGTAVMLFILNDGVMEFARGFDVAFSEPMRVCVSDGTVLIWLTESHVIFSVDENGIVVDIRKLSGDNFSDETPEAESENGLEFSIAAAEELFGDGVGDRSTVGGIRFSVSDPTESPFGTLYGRLLLTDNNGSVTALYGTFDITKAGTAVTCAIAGVALLIASATVAVELIYIEKKKKSADSDVSESAEGENI